jgi:hypothetical protein
LRASKILAVIPEWLLQAICGIAVFPWTRSGHGRAQRALGNLGGVF